MRNSKDKNDPGFRFYLRGNIEDALALSKEEYEKKTIDRFLRGEQVVVEITNE